MFLYVSKGDKMYKGFCDSVYYFPERYKIFLKFKIKTWKRKTILENAYKLSTICIRDSCTGIVKFIRYFFVNV